MFSFEQAEDKAIQLHRELFPQRKSALYRRYDFAELNQVHVQFSEVIPGSKYPAESDTEYWIDLEVGIAVRGIFDRPAKVRHPSELAVHEDKYLAEIVAETAKRKKWNSIDIRNAGPRYGRLLSYGSGFRKPTADMERDLRDGYLVLLNRVTALDADSWDDDRKVWAKAIYFVVDALTGRVMSVTDGEKLGGAPISPASRYGLRPGFSVTGTWRYGGVEGQLHSTTAKRFHRAKTIYLYNATQAARFDLDYKQGLVQYANKTYRPSAKLLARLRSRQPSQ